jgi:hypothetical protein
MNVPFTAEMPTAWVCALDTAIEAHGWETTDAHESAIVLPLTEESRLVVGADDDDRYVLVGWDEAGTHWGIGTGPSRIDQARPLGGTTPVEIAARVDQLLRTGRPEPRIWVRHARPYVEPSPGCCPTVHPCGGIVPDADCTEHGDRRAPAMAWHWETNCPPGASA